MGPSGASAPKSSKYLSNWVPVILVNTAATTLIKQLYRMAAATAPNKARDGRMPPMFLNVGPVAPLLLGLRRLDQGAVLRMRFRGPL